MTNKPEQWEEEFGKLSAEWEQHRKSNTCSICDSPKGHTEIKDFIRIEIEKAEKRGLERAIEIAKELHDEKESELHGGYDDADYLSAYQAGLENVSENLRKELQ